MDFNYKKLVIENDVNSETDNDTTPEEFSDRNSLIKTLSDREIRCGLNSLASSSAKEINEKQSKDETPELGDETNARRRRILDQLTAGMERLKQLRANRDLAKKENSLATLIDDDDDDDIVPSRKSSPYSLLAAEFTSRNGQTSAKKSSTKIRKEPSKILAAPNLEDDFYLNLVDWSSTNLVSFGLGSCVHLYNPFTSQVTRLCDLSQIDNELYGNVTSVSWSEGGKYLAVGCGAGQVQLWDVIANKRITTLMGHQERVGSLAWSGDILISGSRDRSILQRDIRTPCRLAVRRLEAHKGEVCGLKWSPDGQNIASGGNDNKLFVWNLHSSQPYQTHHEHTAAVKAIAWSPHQRGLFASGGGTGDGKIRFWDTLTGKTLHMVDTGSQVCNLAWSKHTSELVSTHGYSLGPDENQTFVWKYPSLDRVAELTGHTGRVLYLATSPDGHSIVTGGSDQTLRFWDNSTETKVRMILELSKSCCTIQ